MKRKSSIILLTLTLVLLSTTLVLAEDDSKANKNLSQQFELEKGDWIGREPVNWNAKKELQYQNNKRYPWLASSLSAAPIFLPSLGLGHAYAGDWGRGLKIFALQGAELALMTIGGESVMTAIAGIAYGGTRLYEVVDAYQTANIYNTKLKHKISIAPDYNQLNITTSYSF